MTEWMLEDTSKAHDFAIWRCDISTSPERTKGRTGQSTPRATHLIKRASQAAFGREPYIEIFGTDFPRRTARACAITSMSGTS